MTALELMAAGHLRTEEHCRLLQELGARVQAYGSDKQARKAAFLLLRYFDNEPPQHYRTEEQLLFPALLESMAGSDPVCIREMTTGLTQEHRRLEALWQRLRTTVRGVAAGECGVFEPGAISAYCSLSASHHRLEDDELLPMAARLLGDAELQALERAMPGRQAASEKQEGTL